MKSFLTNWKTSGSGVLMILVGVGSLTGLTFGAPPMSADVAITTIMGGIGLLFAKDGNVTGGSVRQ